MDQARARVDRANEELRIILQQGLLVYDSVQLLSKLRQYVRAWIANLGVQVEFDPQMPPKLRDYLAAGALGAIEGAFAGGMVGLIFGTFLGSPAAGLALGVGLGAAGGAALGIDAVKCGLRGRVHACWTVSGMPMALVEVQ
jgi:hypothetical protein